MRSQETVLVCWLAFKLTSHEITEIFVNLLKACLTIQAYIIHVVLGPNAKYTKKDHQTSCCQWPDTMIRIQEKHWALKVLPQRMEIMSRKIFVRVWIKSWFKKDIDLQYYTVLLQRTQIMSRKRFVTLQYCWYAPRKRTMPAMAARARLKLWTKESSEILIADF